MRTLLTGFQIMLTIALLVLLSACENKPAETAKPSASQASIPGPVAGTRLTEDYVRSVGTAAYLWGWPMVNMHNRKLILSKLPEPGLMGGIVPVAPMNQLSMVHDYIDPGERLVACSNQDVVYGFGLFSLDQEPVVVQVPDFGDRFWVYQVVDQRTDFFVQLGKMYGTKPGFYLLARPDWNGTVPSGINGVFHSKTNLRAVIPRVFMGDTAADRQAIQPLLTGILMYPLSKFTGQNQTKDWTKVPSFPNASTGEEETKWVQPESYFDELGAILKEVPPLPGEEAVYANMQSVLDAAAKDPKLYAALVASAVDADKNLINPLFQFHNSGLPLAYNWTTINNGAAFGTDYYSRAAVAKSNIFVNSVRETKYFYQDADGTGEQLNGNHAYSVTFASGQLPPVKGFWSLTLYNQHHFFSPNEIKRYSIGTKNKTLVTAPDGSLTIYVQSTPPDGDKRANWLPAPKENFVLYIRAYWPEESALNGGWTPPTVTKAKVDSVVTTQAIPAFLAGAKGFGTQKGGWSVTYKAGRFEDDMMTRDVINYGRLWGNEKSEAIYFIGLTDKDKQPLSGDNEYEIHFPADALPGSEVDAFWSVTLYSVPDYRVVENPLKRYGLNNVSPLKKNPDGSLTIWLASSMPKGIPPSNWLPTPAGKGFSLNLRTYVPKQDVRDGKWFPPPIEKVAE